MTWLTLALIGILSVSVANLFQKLAMKKEESDPVISTIAFQFITAIFAFIFSGIEGFKLPPVSLIFPNFLISTVFYGFGTLLIFKAIKEIEASEMAILVGASSIATIATAFLFLGERLSLLQFLGVLLILSSVVIAEFKRNSFKLNKGAVYALLGNVLYGLAVTNDTFILKSYDAISYTAIMLLLPGLLISIIYPLKFMSLIKNLKSHLSLNLGIFSFLYGIQAVTYYLALQTGALASQISIIFKSEIILTIILATIFLKERKNLIIKIIAAILVTVGVIFLI